MRDEMKGRGMREGKGPFTLGETVMHTSAEENEDSPDSLFMEGVMEALPGLREYDVEVVVVHHMKLLATDETLDEEVRKRLTSQRSPGNVVAINGTDRPREWQ